MIFEWTQLNRIPSEVIRDFDCGEYVFNEFLFEQASIWMSEGYAVTYVAVDKDELDNNSISRIYAYSSVNATGLLLNNQDKNQYLSCAEIRMFAVSKFLRGKEAVDIDGVRYSYKLFQSLMQELYYISTSILDFCAVTLNANSTGISLYKQFGFIYSEEYILPDEEAKIDIEDCTPLIFSFMNKDTMDRLFL